MFRDAETLARYWRALPLIFEEYRNDGHGSYGGKEHIRHQEAGVGHIRIPYRRRYHGMICMCMIVKAIMVVFFSSQLDLRAPSWSNLIFAIVDTQYIGSPPPSCANNEMVNVRGSPPHGDLSIEATSPLSICTSSAATARQRAATASQSTKLQIAVPRLQQARRRSRLRANECACAVNAEPCRLSEVETRNRG